MKKTKLQTEPDKPSSYIHGRILARVLAEELANVHVSGAGLTTVATEPETPGGRRDITNLAGDNDGIEY